MADEPKFSVSAVTTINSSFEEDLVSYREAGADGIGLWEFKLPEGPDEEAVRKLKESGLPATVCIPATLSPLPVTFPGPTDPEERIEGLCAAIRRFAPFEPLAVLCLTGDRGQLGHEEARAIVVGGLRRAAKVCAEYGITLGLEPLHREIYADWTTITTIPETISMIDEIDEPNVKVLFDVYHLWDTPDVLEHIRRHASRFVPAVHVCDKRDPTRSDFDRVLPGDGIIDLPAIFGALDAGGFEGWADLEIFSDDGTFGQSFDDSLWKLPPAEVVRRGKAGFQKAWGERSSVPV